MFFFVSPGSISVLLGNGDGTFQPYVDYGVGVDPTGVSAGDFRGSGKPDLAVINTQSNSVSILLGNGDGTLQFHVDYPVAQYPDAVAVADFK